MTEFKSQMAQELKIVPESARGRFYDSSTFVRGQQGKQVSRTFQDGDRSVKRLKASFSKGVPELRIIRTAGVPHRDAFLEALSVETLQDNNTNCTGGMLVV